MTPIARHNLRRRCRFRLQLAALALSLALVAPSSILIVDRVGPFLSADPTGFVVGALLVGTLLFAVAVVAVRSARRLLRARLRAT